MDKKSEYHKKDEYHGERESSDKTSGLVSMIIAALLIIIIAGFSWNYMASQKQAFEIESLKQQIDKFDSAPVAVKPEPVVVKPIPEKVKITDTLRPTILYVSPANNQQSIETNITLTVRFSEPMSSDTINKNTFTVYQRTTPSVGSPNSDYRSTQVEGNVKYSGLVATFIPKITDSHNPFQPNQQYGNVFTATVTTGAKDAAGNSLSQNYVWSFTTGEEDFNTGTTTSQTGG